MSVLGLGLGVVRARRAASGGGPGSWTPDAIASLYAWYQSDAAGNTYTGGEYLTLADLTGNGHTATIWTGGSIAATNGIDGRQTLTPDQSPDPQSMSLTDTHGFAQNRAGVTMAAVYAIDPDDVSATIRTVVAGLTDTLGFTRVGIDASDGSVNHRPRAYGRRLDADGSATIAAAGGAKASATVTIGVFDFANGQLYCSSDGTVTSAAYPSSGNSSNTASATNLFLGCFPTASGHFRGPIGEVLLFTEALSESDRKHVEGYLHWQWGLEGSLPAPHPFKTEAP